MACYFLFVILHLSKYVTQKFSSNINLTLSMTSKNFFFLFSENLMSRKKRYFMQCSKGKGMKLPTFIWSIKNFAKMIKRSNITDIKLYKLSNCNGVKPSFCQSQKQLFTAVLWEAVLKNYPIITEKQQCWSLLISVADPKAKNCIKKSIQCRCFPMSISKFLRTVLFTEHIRWLRLSKLLKMWY